jgi:outer membrane receptor protein involved in Fe transport
MMKTVVGALAPVCLALLAMSTQAFAQGATPTGGVNGRVADPDGLTVPGASVSILNPQSGAVKFATTGDAGTFEFTGLLPGTYRVRAELGGFTPAERQDVQVTAGSTTAVELVLTLLTFGETVVVTASRKEEMVRYSPAAISVIGGDDLLTKPVQNYADVLRAVPGVNLIQFSARDVQFTARGAASQASSKTLALIDGRSAYQPYYGMIIWDLLGVDFDEIKQVEVMRGPATPGGATTPRTGGET